MKLLYDAQLFLGQKAGGISRYHYELFKGMRRLQYDAQIAGIFVKNQYLLSDPEFRKSFINDPTATFAFFNKLFIKNALKRRVSDLIFHPANPYSFLHDELTALPHSVFTIHDMIAEEESGVVGLEKLHYAQCANKIIAVSEATKKDIVRFLSISPDKIEVIYHGSSLSPIHTQKPKSQLPDQFILYIGDRNSHKNFQTFIRGIAGLLLRNKDLYLVCAGKRKFSNQEEQLLAELSIRNKVDLHTQLSNDELTYLYVKSRAFVFPSLKEGFGIPILEAWSCNTPVILSNNDCFKEVAEDAGYYFDPTQPEAISDAVENVLLDSDLQKALVAKDQKRMALFSWEKSVQEHLRVYKSVLEK